MQALNYLGDSESDIEAALDAEERAPAEREAQNQSALRAAFDEVCKAANVHQGDGPDMAYFRIHTCPQEPEDGDQFKQYDYLAFGMTGLKTSGAAMAVCKDFKEVLRVSVATFRAWLHPNRTLVWRERPIVDINDNRQWSSYWRCVQLDDDAREIIIKWWF